LHARQILASVAVAVLLGALICPSHPVRAAQAPVQPTFRASTTLVEFTMVVQDRNGNPVTDLTQDEIAIMEAGRKRDVAFFRFEGAKQVPVVAASLPRGMFSNRPEYSHGTPRNITAIVIDALNTAPADQLTVRAQLMQYLNTITPDTRVALYRAGEQIEVLHDFTSDVRSLYARFSNNAIEAPQHTGIGVTVPIPDLPEYQRELLDEHSLDIRQIANREQARLHEGSNVQIQNSRSSTTLRSLEILGNHLAAIPGRKSIVWITPGTPLMSLGASDRWLTSYEAAMLNVARRMATQGITVYPVEAFGIRPPDMQINPPAQGAGSGTASTAATRAAVARAAVETPKDATVSSDERRLPASMETLAKVTGGRILRNTNDLTAGMKTAASDLRGAYSIGFYVPQNPDNQWHTFKVHVSRPGLKVIHRQGYLGIPAHQPAEWKDDDWRAAANNPLGSTAIRLDARFTLLTDLLNIVVQIPAEDLQIRRINNAPVTELEVALAEKTPQGLLGLRHEALTFQMQESVMSDLTDVKVRFPKDWPLKQNATLVRLLIRDRFTDRYGTIDVTLRDLIR
jgi:VWFA-related protein